MVEQYPTGNKGIRVTASVILPSVENSNKFIYVLNRKHSRWSLPAGKLNPFEHPEKAAVREVYEETGLTVKLSGIVGIWSFKSPSGNSILNIVYAGEITSGYLAPKDAGIKEAKALTLEEVQNLSRNGLLTGKANLDALDIFLRNERQIYPLEVIMPEEF